MENENEKLYHICWKSVRGVSNRSAVLYPKKEAEEIVKQQNEINNDTLLVWFIEEAVNDAAARPA